MMNRNVISRIIYYSRDLLGNHYITVFIFYVIFGSFIFRNLLFDVGIWNYGDNLFPMNKDMLSNYNNLISHTWWDHEFLGYETVEEGIARTSHVWLLNLGYLIFRDFSVAQFFFWSIIFTLSGILMYSLAYYLFKKVTIAFPASLIYALNPWFVDRMSHVLISQAYAFTPLIFLFYILCLDKGNFKYMFCFASTAFFIIPSPHCMFMVAILLLLYFFYRLATDRDGWRTYFISSLKATSITIILLGFFSFPFFLLFIEDGGLWARAARYAVAIQGWPGWGRNCTVLNVIRLLGFHNSMFNFLTPGWVFLSFIIPVLWSVPLLIKSHKRFRNEMYFFYTLIIIGICLSSVDLLGGSLQRYIRFIPTSVDPHNYIFILAFAEAPLFGIGAYIFLKKLEIF